MSMPCALDNCGGRRGDFTTEVQTGDLPHKKRQANHYKM